jgi:hypothetical protein
LANYENGGSIKISITKNKSIWISKWAVILFDPKDIF